MAVPERLRRAQVWVLAQLRAAKPSFMSRSPHFNFISAHYFWVISLTILASVLIYGTAGGKLAYIDALFFASGSNTQAGLNTVNVNSLNTFAQVCIYIFTMTSNPITIHSSVVVLRLYWFEKHFQDLVKGARAKRATMSKSRAKAQDDTSRAERGVAGQHITLMPNSGSRITNDGILLERKDKNDGHESPGSTGTAVPSSDMEDGHQETVGPKRNATNESNAPQISFARTVTRGDGLKTFPQSPTSGKPPILGHRRRDSNRDEILRIPNPRDAEKGMKPRRLQEGDAPEADEEEDANQPGMRSPPHSLPNTRPNTPPPAMNPRSQRNPTITIAEPTRREERPKRDRETNGDNERPESKRDTIDELTEDATAFGNVLELFKIRKPRIFQRGDRRHHVDSDEEEDGDDPRRNPRVRRRTFDVLKGALTGDKVKVEQAPYLSWTPTLGRNSQFPGLTMEQREELGGIEFRSLRTLAIILFCYFWGFWIFAFVCLLPWIYASGSQQYAAVVEEAGVSKTWWGFFTANSAFLDLGLTLTPDSMISFSRSQYTLMMMTFLIIAGNTGFPVLLRAFIWILAKIVPRNSGLWEELRFLLDHPRRCFTLLFPAGATWSLFWILVGLNLIDLVFFIILDLNADVVNDLPVHLRIVNGLFQAACTRTAGFSSVNLAELHPAVQVSYMMMMYISVFPIAISIRRTNVYEEKSLGVYNNQDDDEVNENSGVSYVGSHLRRQLSFDLWFVFLGLFILCITEGNKIQRNEFNVYSVLFEIISAYGTVGLSLGYTGVDASLSSQFSTLGKLVIIAMQIRGRHRGLPYGLDRAVLLPSAKRFEEEAMDAQPGLARQATHMTTRTMRTTGAASGVDPGLWRGRSRDRGLITSFLHPGPPVTRGDRPLSRSRRGTMDFNAPRMDAGPLQRRYTEPADEEAVSDTEEDFQTRARRVYTTPAL
ncbi:low-affinity potassium transport protein [Plectosphaerella cucumerina]|uniref:Potassium transport protein n=1 Tax=Plectosphaerella cucumerina TaxID=40658 RepID=A0A8K0TC31_9PEZI|nr:low-affinity potassium transport protein [Plectosphaerella cucumerina]